ncbi:L-aspartate oxidase [compost metagenome]
MKIHSDILELRNIATVADISVECALRRKESRGINYNIDYPWVKADEKTGFEQGQDTIIVRGLN